MNNRSLAGAGLIAGLCLALGAAGMASTQATSPGTVQKKEVPMAKRASGAFEVKMTPQAASEGDDSNLGRMSLDKQFHGDLEATSKGQMLAAMTEVQGSAGYVAMERVSGTLQDRKGTFVLQHSGTMSRGEPQLSITVVPDSGTGQLVGLSGKMSINIAEGKHSYDFEYTLPDAP
jgi:hypothetical protein